MPVKADATVRLAKLIQAAGAPIHGIGFQGHITLGQTPSRENMTWTLNKFTALGLDVAYTELDMRIKGVPINDASLEQQAKEYEAVIGSCLDVSRCVGVTVWGFGDARSWIKNGDPDLFDKNTKPKPAFSRVSALLASASGKRPPWNTGTVTTTVTPIPTAMITKDKASVETPTI
jgi:endo-1,4-beta-xylanase